VLEISFKTAVCAGCFQASALAFCILPINVLTFYFLERERRGRWFRLPLHTKIGPGRLYIEEKFHSPFNV